MTQEPNPRAVLGGNQPPPGDEVPYPVWLKREAERKVEETARALIKAIGPRVVLNPFRSCGIWVKWANKKELKRLAVLQARADRRRILLGETEAEIRAIAHRCTTRRRRAEGKQ